MSNTPAKFILNLDHIAQISFVTNVSKISDTSSVYVTRGDIVVLQLFFGTTQCFARGTSAQRLILNFGIILSDDLCSDSRSVTHFLFSNVLLSPQCYGK